MKPRKILITAGPTKEYIDPVRFISNDSSGKMGYLLAEEAKRRKAEVILISGPTNLQPPKRIKVINVVSAEQMFGYVKKYFKRCDVFISCAAVSDFRPKNFSRNKIKKEGKSINIKLIPNPDILSEVTRSPLPAHRSPLIIGFALETENLIKNAKKKLKEKKLNIIVANRIEAINSSRTTGAIITKDSIKKFRNIPKQVLAKRIFNIMTNITV